jgi:cytoskeleton protein RodZ
MDTEYQVLETEAEAAFRAKPDGSCDPAGEAGWFMQRERERRGISLEAAGEACGVHPHHLAAIETGDMSNMPERDESLTMIGAYAQYLGFEAEPLLQHFVDILPQPLAAPVENHPANPGWLSSAKVIRFGRPFKMPTFKISAVPGGAGGLIASCCAAIMLFAGASWYLSPGGDDAPAREQVASAETPAIAVPADRPPADEEQAGDFEIVETPMPDANALPQIETDVAQEEPASDLGDMAKFIEDNVDGEAKPAETATASTDPVPAPAAQGGREFGGENSASRLVLKAKAPVWVRVEDTQGNVVMTQMLMAGDLYRVPERDDLIVIARDGGLIAYQIDGKEKGVLGPPGEILVGRPLTLKELDKKG